jgi:hypothetical protein
MIIVVLVAIPTAANAKTQLPTIVSNACQNIFSLILPVSKAVQQEHT